MNIVILGASGLVGSKVLEFAINDSRIKTIYLISRKHDFKNISEKVVVLTHKDLFIDEEFLSSHNVHKVDVVLCALGTTIKKAGNKKEFEKIDKDLVIHLAKIFKKIGTYQFSVISALGADSKSSIFYNQVKGKMEEELKNINFTSLVILRPSLLLGNRNEFRAGEKLMIKLSPVINKLLVGNLKKYQGIDANLVAHFLFFSIFNSNSGVKIFENVDMLKVKYP